MLIKKKNLKRYVKHSNNQVKVIPKLSLYYGMPLTGKSTMILKQYLADFKKYHVNDLCINLWTFLHRSKQYPTHTPDYINARYHGQINDALPLPYDPMRWYQAFVNFKQSHPVIKHAFIDEAQCINATLLTTLIMVIRDFYPHVPILMTSIDFDSWHNKFTNIDSMLAMVSNSKHLNHKCMVDGCNKIATRRLHLIDNKPCYDQSYCDWMMEYHHSEHKFDLISTCSRHYHHPVINGHQY